VKLYKHDTKRQWKELEGEELTKELMSVAEQVLTLEPQVILMDQGLISIKGSDLVRTIRESSDGSNIIFVANTGGTTDKLYSAGCLTNFDKGKDARNVIEEILSYIR